MTTETGYVYNVTLPRAELVTLLTHLFKPKDAAIVRRVDSLEFLSFNAELVEQWSEAQVFNEVAEVRWRRSGDTYLVLLLSEQSKEVLLAEQYELEEKLQLINSAPFIIAHPSSRQEHGFLLWGTRLVERQQGASTASCSEPSPVSEWWETRIPRALQYPGFPKGDNKKPPQLAYRLYHDDEAVRWVRLTKLVEVQANE